MSLNSTDLELVVDGHTSQVVGVRFADLRVPPGATITNAYVQFLTDKISAGPSNLRVTGQAADNASTFSKSKNNISSRPRTTAAVTWTPPDWTVVNARGPDQRTPDISAVIQEIVNRARWASGNAVAVIFTGTGRRTAAAYEDGSTPPTLHVDYRP